MSSNLSTFTSCFPFLCFRSSPSPSSSASLSSSPLVPSSSKQNSTLHSNNNHDRHNHHNTNPFALSTSIARAEKEADIASKRNGNGNSAAVHPVMSSTVTFPVSVSSSLLTSTLSSTTPSSSTHAVSPSITNNASTSTSPSTSSTENEIANDIHRIIGRKNVSSSASFLPSPLSVVRYIPHKEKKQNGNGNDHLGDIESIDEDMNSGNEIGNENHQNNNNNNNNNTNYNPHRTIALHQHNDKLNVLANKPKDSHFSPSSSSSSFSSLFLPLPLPPPPLPTSPQLLSPSLSSPSVPPSLSIPLPFPPSPSPQQQHLLPPPLLDDLYISRLISHHRENVLLISKHLKHLRQRYNCDPNLLIPLFDQLQHEENQLNFYWKMESEITSQRINQQRENEKLAKKYKEKQEESEEVLVEHDVSMTRHRRIESFVDINSGNEREMTSMEMLASGPEEKTQNIPLYLNVNRSILVNVNTEREGSKSSKGGNYNFHPDYSASPSSVNTRRKSFGESELIRISSLKRMELREEKSKEKERQKKQKEKEKEMEKEKEREKENEKEQVKEHMVDKESEFQDSSSLTPPIPLPLSSSRSLSPVPPSRSPLLLPLSPQSNRCRRIGDTAYTPKYYRPSPFARSSPQSVVRASFSRSVSPSGAFSRSSSPSHSRQHAMKYQQQPTTVGSSASSFPSSSSSSSSSTSPSPLPYVHFRANSFSDGEEKRKGIMRTSSRIYDNGNGKDYGNGRAKIVSNSFSSPDPSSRSKALSFSLQSPLPLPSPSKSTKPNEENHIQKHNNNNQSNLIAQVDQSHQNATTINVNHRTDHHSPIASLGAHSMASPTPGTPKQSLEERHNR